MGTNNKFKYHILSGILSATVVSMILIVHSCKKLEIERIAKVATGNVSHITTHSATITGNIMDIGETEITQYGHCWHTEENPEVEFAATTTLGMSDVTGNYTSEIDELQPGTQYFARAYVISDDRISYGKNISFSTNEVTLPEVTTDAPYDIGTNSATCGGNVISDGGGEVTMRGVCWSIAADPVITNTHTSDGSGTGSFTSNLTGLSINSEYFVRAYATNSAGTAYGNQVSFITEKTKPVLTTGEIGLLTDKSVRIGGNITSDGGAEIVERGICWNITQNPDIYDNKIPAVTGISEFFCDIEGLLPNTVYHCRAFATNEIGTSYGDDMEFKTYGVMDIDGNGYYSVIIGAQEWMQQNLSTTHYADGSSLIDGSEAGDITDNFVSKYYFANCNDENNVADYGRLYTWAAVMNGSSSSSTNPSGVTGVCPQGWHVPSDAEWMELEIFLGMSTLEAEQKFDRGTDEGGKLKSTSYFWAPNTGATNESGFNAIPGGDRGSEGNFNYVGGFAVYWSATESYSQAAYIRGLEYNKATVNRWDHFKYYGFSVRCIKD
jgi:uncharacterized protein (TIGR02145 family)